MRVLKQTKLPRLPLRDNEFIRGGIAADHAAGADTVVALVPPAFAEDLL